MRRVRRWFRRFRLHCCIALADLMVAGESLRLTGLFGALGMCGAFIAVQWQVFTMNRTEEALGTRELLSLAVVMPIILICLGMAAGRLRLLLGYEPMQPRRFHFPFRRGNLSYAPGYDVTVFPLFLNALGGIGIFVILLMLVGTLTPASDM